MIRLLALAMAMAASVNAMEITPIYRASLLGGQYFLRGENASLGGNADVLAAPVMQLNDKWTLMPMLNSLYQGTKGTLDGTAAGTLFQQKMDHTASVTGIYALGSSTWRMKPSTGYRRQFLKETLDETWGQGLFDYEKISGGLEMENVYRDPFSFRAAFDFYRVRFPNYQSLESNVQADPQGDPLRRELAGTNTLNNYNYQLTVAGNRPFPYEDPKLLVTASYSLRYQFFPEQRLVDQQGQYSRELRKDYLQTLGATVAYPRPLFGGAYRLNLAWSTNFAHNGSNQNTFDATRTQFMFDTYSYFQLGFGPSASLAWGDVNAPAFVSLAFTFSTLQYQGRQNQNADGVYLGSRQWQDQYAANLTYLYPVMKGLSFKMQGNLLWQDSNQYFENTYSYIYRTATYTLGLVYEY